MIRVRSVYSFAGIFAFAGLLCLSLFSCVPYDTSSYRFRMTVEVNTPEGIRSGSSVYEVSAGKQPQILPDARSRFLELRGEAVAVEMAPNTTLFVLLRQSFGGKSLAVISINTLDPKLGPIRDIAESVERIAKPPRTKAPVVVRSDAYPMLVTFRDVEDPASIELVEPDSLESEFGEGTSLVRISLQITDDPVATGIDRRLGWLNKIRSMNLKASQFPEGIPLGDFSGLFKKGS